ncbi:MAG: hypothetical protein U1G07_01975 [Verrucomicrobiota bacterium]
MNRFAGPGWLALILVAGCSTATKRERERVEAFEAMPPAAQALVARGHIENGMDTNAVYIAWGQPSTVVENAAAAAPQTTWVYQGNRVRHLPSWSYRPNYLGYWTLEPTTLHFPEAYVKAKVVFQSGRVVEWQEFDGHLR